MKNELGLKIIKHFSLDKKLLRLSGQQKIAKKLKTLHNGVLTEKQLYRAYLAKKAETICLAITGILLLAVILWIMPVSDSNLLGNSIVRNGYEGEEKSVKLIAKSEGMEDEIEVLVEPVHYTKNELDKLANRLFDSVPGDYFFSDKVTGEGVYVIKNHLQLPTQAGNYPFELSWESSNCEVMDNEGNIICSQKGVPEEVNMTLTLSCYEYSWEREYTMLVYMPDVVWEDAFSKKVGAVIEELDNASAESEKLILPVSIDGHSITYEEKSENTIIIIWGLGFVILVFLWILPDNNLSAKICERNSQLLTDYALLVNKLTLYMGAGLSLRSTIAKIVQSANKSRFYAKELEIAIREMENGISEQTVMEEMAKRCQIPCYIKLSVILNQNVRKGNNSLQRQLKEEVVKAFEERKNLAGKYGQEATTKLLFPMILMLLVVMVMIMYPAFVSFTI